MIIHTWPDTTLASVYKFQTVIVRIANRVSNSHQTENVTQISINGNVIPIDISRPVLQNT